MKPTANKGFVLEELLRAYFLRSGFYVIRGVPLKIAEEDLTDVDLWLYERPTGTSRRVQICDIKYKQRPKAIERLFWTSGLSKALNVNGAYVATTDKRQSLRKVAEKLDLQIIDGEDIQRIQASNNIIFTERLDDEQFVIELRSVDQSMKSKTLQDVRIDILSSLSEGFGAPSAVRALHTFCDLAEAVVNYHPNSINAKVTARLVYLSASIVCQSLDYVSVGAAFRSIEEKRSLILEAIRYGALSSESGKQALKLAIGLITKYAPFGKAAASVVENGLRADLNKIPAEIVADQAIQLLKSDALFDTGKDLEMMSYLIDIPSFDNLSLNTKSMLGALLDYAGVDREKFANSWKTSPENLKTLLMQKTEAIGQSSLGL